MKTTGFMPSVFIFIPNLEFQLFREQELCTADNNLVVGLKALGREPAVTHLLGGWNQLPHEFVRAFSDVCPGLAAMPYQCRRRNDHAFAWFRAQLHLPDDAHANA